MSVHLLPFNTKFRGTTNISDHFKPQPLDVSKYITPSSSANQLQQNQDIDNSSLSIHMKINKVANTLPYEQDIYLAAPKPEKDEAEEENKNEDDAANIRNEQQNAESASLFVTHFRGRKLIGRKVDVGCQDQQQQQQGNGDDNIPAYVGVVALVPLQEEEEDEEIHVGKKKNAQQVESSKNNNQDDNNNDDFDGFIPNWNKKTNNKNHNKSATTDDASTKESGVRRQRGEGDENYVEDGPQRLTEPSLLMMDQQQQQPSDEVQKPTKQNAIVINGRIPTARSLVPLETFESFVVWEHDKVSTNTTSPAIGIKLWFGVAEALHGY